VILWSKELTVSEDFNSSREERTRMWGVIYVLLVIWAGILLYMVFQNTSTR